MAAIYKTRAHNPLAKGEVHRSINVDGNGRATYINFMVRAPETPYGQPRYINLKVDRDEASLMAMYIAQMLVPGSCCEPGAMRERLSPVPALRKLADLLESGEGVGPT